MQMSATQHGLEVDREEMARRFVLLLERFPRRDGEPWRPSEIEEATGKQVTASYVTALKTGKFLRPGAKQRRLIANVMGFPQELFDFAPEVWDEVPGGKRRVSDIDTLSDEDRRLVEAAQHLDLHQRSALLVLAHHLGAKASVGGAA